jgi:hypothetical protein
MASMAVRLMKHTNEWFCEDSDEFEITDGQALHVFLSFSRPKFLLDNH